MQGYFYVHTNEDARDYKILRCKNDMIGNLEEYIPAKKETVIGGFEFLDNYIIRSEKSDAIPKLYVRNIKTDEEEEIKISEEEIGPWDFFDAKRYKYYKDKSKLGKYGDPR